MFTSLKTAAALLTAAVLLTTTACKSDDGTSSKEVANGTATYPSPAGQRTVTVDALDEDGKTSGTVVVSEEDGTDWTIDIQCQGSYEGALVLAGEIAAGSPKAGTHAALLVKDADPDKISVWFEDPPPASTCEGFVAAMPSGLESTLQLATGDITQG